MFFGYIYNSVLENAQSQVHKNWFVFVSSGTLIYEIMFHVILLYLIEKRSALDAETPANLKVCDFDKKNNGWCRNSETYETPSPFQFTSTLLWNLTNICQAYWVH